MSEATESLDEEIITLTGEDGESYDFRLLMKFDFEGKEYVLLLYMGESGQAAEPEAESDATLVIMEMVVNGEQVSFKLIEDDAEFEKVSEFARQVASEVADEWEDFSPEQEKEES